MRSELERVVDYHSRTKHLLGRYARGPGRLDWATQPDPFRRYRGAPLIALEQVEPGELPTYADSFRPGRIVPKTLDRTTISQLFYDSLALSAWKRWGDTSWSLRVNPSSGNLHPTEGYLVSSAVNGLTEVPMVCHYAPREHALEVRTEFPLAVWRSLSAGLPAEAILVGLTSIHWREAWKYGERAFRYCQLDVGHAVAAICVAAAGLGWQATLLDDIGTGQLGRLLGVLDPHGAEAEHPDCLLAVYPQVERRCGVSLPGQHLSGLTGSDWIGRPNLLSSGHTAWSIINEVATATEKPATEEAYGERSAALDSGDAGPGNLESAEHRPDPAPGLRQIIRQRRSAMAMDGRGRMAQRAFYETLRKTLPQPEGPPFGALPWRPLVHLVLFVHRVDDLAPGLYILVRDPGQQSALQAAMADGFDWQRPKWCPEGLDLFRLQAGDVRATARQLSCLQDIASDGCFSLGMLAEFEEPLRRYGAWFYRRLFWECGMIGQVLYLEAEVAGLRGTGIGCFFDDEVHELLGMESLKYQSLYHFTVGRPVEDDRLTTLPGYPAGR